MPTYAGTLYDLGGAVYNALNPDTGIVGDGSTDDGGDLGALANTTIPSTGGRIVFPPGTYRLGSTVTIPSHVAVALTPGAVLAPDTGVTLTIEGPVEAGAFTIFGGAGSIALTGDAGPVRPEWFGATGSGSGDDSGAIDAAATAAGSYGEVLFSAGRTYRITSGITCSAEGQVWRMDGATVAVAFNGVGLTVGSATDAVVGIQIHGGAIVASPSRRWDLGTVGVQWVNNTTGHYTGFRITGFDKGLSLLGTNDHGQAYCVFQPVWIRGCRQPIHLLAEEGGWCNENLFMGGSIKYYSSDPDASGYSAIRLTRDVTSTPHELNNNHFVGVALENAIPAPGGGQPDERPNAIFCNGHSNQFIGLRYEGFAAPFITMADDIATYGVEDARAGGNVIAWGMGLTTPEAVVDSQFQYYQFYGQRSNWLGGGSSLEPILTLREVSSFNHVALRVTTTNQTSVFEVGSGGKLTIGASGTAITRHLSATTTWDPPSVAAGGVASTTVTVTNARVGNTVSVGFDVAVPAGALLVGAVTANDTVTVSLFNATGAPLDLGSGTLRADVWQH